MRTMTVKDLHVMTKYGATTQDLIEKFGYNSEKELYEGIRGLVKLGADDFIKSLRVSTKRAMKMQAKMHAEPEKIEIQQETIPEEEITNANGENEGNDASKEDQISQLEEQEAQLSAICIQSETEQKSLYKSKHKIEEKLAKCKKELENIQKQFEIKQKEVAKDCEEYSEIIEKILLKSDEMSESKKLLADVRNQIAELKKVYVLMELNGIVETIGPAPKVEESKNSEDFTTLTLLPEAEELTIKEVKQVAMIIKMEEIMKNDKQIFEVDFENPKAKALYDVSKNKNCKTC